MPSRDADCQQARDDGRDRSQAVPLPECEEYDDSASECEEHAVETTADSTAQLHHEAVRNVAHVSRIGLEEREERADHRRDDARERQADVSTVSIHILPLRFGL
jgi:hypothetical protein